MTLHLDHNQRLNLVAMFDALECQGRREVWAICALQAQLDLTDEERQAIGWRKLKAEDGREYHVWNSNGPLNCRDYDFSQEDLDRVCRAVDSYRVVLARDKSWWKPLTDQLPRPPESVNGDKPAMNGATP